MKKISILTLALLAGASMSAQTALLKEADKAFKNVNSYGQYKSAVKALEPAFTNPETQKLAQTYVAPSKGGFAVYDKMYAEKTLGKDVNLIEMGSALLDGYKYGMLVIANDTIVDAKGKVKTKYSKDAASAIAGHANDFANAGNAFWDAKDYNKAYEAFKTYVVIPGNPQLGKYAPKALADSVASQFEYYAGLSAWQAERLAEAAACFDRVLELGSNDISAYDYAYSVAYQLKDEPRKLAYSLAGFKKFGTQKPEFLQRVVNSYIDSKDYATAQNMLKEAIAAQPDNGAYYLSLAVLYDNQNNAEEAKNAYKKAVELDAKSAYANYYYGRALLQEFDRLDQAAANMPTPEYNKYRVTKLNPILNEAIGYLEKAYELDNELTDPLRYLKNVYYLLNDGKNLERVEKLLLQ